VLGKLDHPQALLGEVERLGAESPGVEGTFDDRVAAGELAELVSLEGEPDPADGDERRVVRSRTSRRSRRSSDMCGCKT